MPVTITINDILLQTNDYLGNYTVGTQPNPIKIRAINRAIEYMQRRMGLPSDEQVFHFNFSADQIYYDMPDAYNEPLQLLYDNVNYNVPARAWRYRKYPDILEKEGINTCKRYFGYTSINGKNQLVVNGPNIFAPQLIDSFDTAVEEGWVGLNDAKNLADDTTQKIQGAASLRFDIVSSVLGIANLHKSNLNLDVSALHARNGFWKFYQQFASANIPLITLTYGTDSSNFYTIMATQQDNGLPFSTVPQWNLLGFNTSNRIATGIPIDNNITFIDIQYTEGVGFGTVPNFRIDDLYWTFPDAMSHIYYSAFKGTHSSIPAVVLSDVGDICYFGLFAPDLLNPIALKAAVMLRPNLLKDPDFTSMYKIECEEVIKVFGRVYPRKRTKDDFGKTYLQRN